MAKTRASTAKASVKARAAKRPPPRAQPDADMRGPSKHRATATKHGASFAAAPIIGKKYEIWRKKDAAGKWQSVLRCRGATKDSLVHRYARVIGYKQSSEAVREEEQNEAIAAARADAAANDQNKSHPQCPVLRRA
jgi:hypothetical protein